MNLEITCPTHVKRFAGYWGILSIQKELAVPTSLFSSTGFSSYRVILEEFHLSDPCFGLGKLENYRKLI